MLKLLIVVSVFLFLLGGAQVLRRLFWTFRWITRGLCGDSLGAWDAEVRLGKAIAESMRAETQPDTDASRTEFVRDMGQKLTRDAQRSRTRLEFLVVRSKQPNAFVLPGGLVFVTDRLVDLCEKDRESLAFVLAHEMAHVLLGHPRDRILGSFVLSALAGSLAGGGCVGQLTHRYLNRVLTSAYSQDQKFEADAKAVKLLQEAGVDPRGGDRLFARFEAIGNDRRRHRYFSTHPPLAARRRRLAALLKRG